MIHLELQPEIEAQLAAEAESRGLALDSYVATIVASRNNSSASAASLYYSYEQQLERELSQGLREIAAGDTRPAREIFAELREEYDIRG